MKFAQVSRAIEANAKREEISSISTCIDGVYRPFSRKRGGASFPEISYFSPLCIHTRRNTATDIRRSRTDEYEGTRRRIDVIIGGGRKRERERCFVFISTRVRLLRITAVVFSIQFFHVVCLANINTPSL